MQPLRVRSRVWGKAVTDWLKMSPDDSDALAYPSLQLADRSVLRTTEHSVHGLCLICASYVHVM